MRTYVNIIVEQIKRQLDNMDDFRLIKLENFPTPDIYMMTCKEIQSFAQKNGIHLVAKLSKEKYRFWNQSPENKEAISWLSTNNCIEFTDQLTKWRNEAFNNPIHKKIAIMLMGTELVLDQGGIEDFYTVNPEAIERSVKDNYSILFDFHNEDVEVLNNVYKNIFKYVEKDLLKVSSFSAKHIDVSNPSYMVPIILESCNEMWGIPNQITLFETVGYDKLKAGVIKEIRKAHNFSRRVGLDNLPSKKKYEEIEKKINLFYELNEDELIQRFDDLFPGYLSYEDLKKDLLNYYSGVEIDEMRRKLSKCDFITIDRILGLKAPDAPKENDKKEKVYGDPINTFVVSILKMICDLDQVTRDTLEGIVIQIDQVKIANISPENNEELQDKWNRFSRFLGGIECIINEMNIVNNEGELIPCTIYSLDEEDDRFYPFSRDSMSKMVQSKTLVAASARDKISKIQFQILMPSKQGRPFRRHFEWCIFDSDNWIQLFEILDYLKIKQLGSLETMHALVPVSFDTNLGMLLDAINVDEFAELYSSADINHINLVEPKPVPDVIDVHSSNLGESFVRLLRCVEENGFFRVLKNVEQNGILLGYLNAYNKLMSVMMGALSDVAQRERIYSLSKSFMILEKSNDLMSKGSSLSLIPSYHPVMLEKIVERYTYLTNGLAEIYKTIISMDKIKKTQIDRQFSRLDQLSTITFATAATLNEHSLFECEKRTFGYTTILGKASLNDGLININAEYAKDDDILDSISGKLVGTPVSRYIEKTIIDYIRVYPFKRDGVKVMFFNPQNYSDIIIAIKNCLKKMATDDEFSQLQLDLIVYTDDFRCRGYSYLKYWIDNNISEEDTINLRSWVKYIDPNGENVSAILKDSIVNGDIAFVSNIMEDISITPDIVKGSAVQDTLSCRYPSTFLPLPKGDNTKRFLAISQLQFECEKHYTQLLTRMSSPFISDGCYRLVKESRLRKETVDVIAELHRKSKWVVILDEAVDPNLIRDSENEVIGFSTGEGYFGELNATISSNAGILDDIQRHLRKRIKSRFNGWTNQDIDKAAFHCVKHAIDLDGAEVLKAINPEDEAINNYLAFYLSTMIEQREKELGAYYYRKLLSLDAYSHLFNTVLDDSGYLQTKPDFILIEIPREGNTLEDNSPIKVDIRIIECKMGSNIFSRVQEAKTQLVEGYKQLNYIWNETKSIQRRYWNNQLYKILSLQNSVHLPFDELEKYTQKIMRIISSEYSISFEQKIYSFSVDEDSNYTEDIRHEGVEISHVNYGKSLIRDLLIDDNIGSAFISEHVHGRKTVRIDSSIIDDTTNARNKAYQEENKNHHQTSDDDVTGQGSTNLLTDTFQNDNETIGITPVLSTVSDRLMYEDRYLSVFNSYDLSQSEDEHIDIKQKLQKLDHELKLRKIKVFVDEYIFGPDIVRITISMSAGVNIDQFTKYSEDMKLWLGVNEKPYIFIKDGKVMMDIVRSNRQTIGLKDMFTSLRNHMERSTIKDRFFALLGADIVGTPKMIDFSDSNTPHLLIAGQTGSGKSVLLNSILISIMMLYRPDEVEMILVDPKFIELTAFNKTPYTKVVATEAGEAIELLEGLVAEMNNRYKLFMETSSKNLYTYNSKVVLNKRLKRVLMVFDEYAAMMEENKEISKRLETAIKVLSQKARAAGIHLIICTQSPRADILTTTIRNNLTARIGLRVADSNASGLIIDSSGAESLLGKGDMLLKTAESSELLRAKSPYVTEGELEKFIEMIKEEKWTEISN